MKTETEGELTVPPSWLLSTPESGCPGSQFFWSINPPHPTPGAAPTPSFVRGSLLPYPLSETIPQLKGPPEEFPRPALPPE